MDDVSIGRGFRALRGRKGWTQRELARRAGLDKSVIGDIEAGRLELVRLPTVRRVGRELGIVVEMNPRWPVGDVARLLDRGHAALVERVVRVLRVAGWEVLVEYTFNDYGERGSVDILAWHAAHKALVLIEVKTRIVDVQDLHAAFDRKARIVPRLIARERGWRAVAIGRLLVIHESHGNRSAVRRHAITFATRFPTGSRGSRTWLRSPVGDLGGLWFLPEEGASHRGA